MKLTSENIISLILESIDSDDLLEIAAKMESEFTNVEIEMLKERLVLFVTKTLATREDISKIKYFLELTDDAYLELNRYS